MLVKEAIKQLLGKMHTKLNIYKVEGHCRTTNVVKGKTKSAVAKQDSRFRFFGKHLAPPVKSDNTILCLLQKE